MSVILLQFLATILSVALVAPACAELKTIASDPNGVNGAASYTYDAVGNRTQKVSTIPGYPGGLTNYNANDQITTDTYDPDGNTTASNGLGYAYDFENHLIQQGGITMVYDGDGNRVKKTVAGITTTYLVDDLNPTGYAQVVNESFSGGTGGNQETGHSYIYGLERVLELRQHTVNFTNVTQPIYYVYDGHGSVRALTDTTGAVTDTYDYDAFGNLIHSTGTTPNNYLFAGEQFDPDLSLYYNRARYLNVSTGRFWTIDSFEGDNESPLSLHKYLYTNADPANGIDPSGHQDYVSEVAAEGISVTADTAPTINLFQTLNGVRASLTVASGLGAKILTNPNVVEEVEGTGEAGIAIVQRSFVQAETVLSEVEAEATSLAENGSRAREVLNQLYTKFPSPNPGNIEYHHLVEQGGVNASRFGRALQSFGNIMPLPEDVHQLISSFYSSASQAWLSSGMRVRDWMATQDWETQWTAGLEIAKEAFLTGKITWHP